MNFEIKDGVLVKYTGNAPDVIIPSNVTEIGKEAFKDNRNIKSVIITDNVTVIGDSAFENCYNLEKITIPEGVTIIGECAFRCCSEIEKIVIPKGVTTISNMAFECCCYAEKIVIPESVTTIGEWAFSHCNYLKEIVIPDGVTTIGEGAFENSYDLEKIVIPESVTEIGEDAFTGTKWLEDKKATEKNVVVVNGIAIARADNIEESVNLEGIKVIHSRCFENCGQVKKFVVSDGTKIGYNAFLTGKDFNICLKHNDFYINIPIKQSEIINSEWSSKWFNFRTQRLFDFIGAGIEERESLFNRLEIPEYRYPIAVFMANVYDSEFFRAFVDVHFAKIQEYAQNNDPDLLKLISSKY